MRREPVDLVVSGGASHVVGLAAAAFVVDDVCDVAAVGGSSAGSIVAAALAMGLSRGEAERALRETLVDSDVLDLSLWPLHRWGLHKGEALKAALRRTFRDAKMGDVWVPLRVVVCDLYERRPVVIDSETPEHRALSLVDVLYASSAIPLFFRAATLPEVWGSRLFVDGGTSANSPFGLFDDTSRRTIGLRLETSPVEPRPVRSTADYVVALAELLLHASNNGHVSRKHWSDVLEVPAVAGSGLQMRLTEDQFRARWEAAEKAARRWVDGR